MTKIEMEKIVQDLIMGTSGVKAVNGEVKVTAVAAKSIVNELFLKITNELKDGNEVVLPSIGKLKVGIKPAKKGTAVLNGVETPYDTPEALKAVFTQADAIKKALNS